MNSPPRRRPRSQSVAGLGMRNVAFWLSLLLLFLIPWENAFALEGLGSIARIGGLLVSGFWAATVLTSGEFRRPKPIHLALLVFVSWNALSFFWSAGPDRTVDRVMTYAQLLVLFVLVWDLYRDVPAIRSGMQAYILGCYVSTVAVVTSFLNNDVYTRSFAADRFSGAGLDPNDLGIVLALGIPMAWFLFKVGDEGPDASNPLVRFVNMAYIPAAVVAVLLGGSRTAAVALLVAVAYILVTLLNARPSMVLAVLVAFAIVGLVVPFLPDATIDRIANTGNDLAAGSLSGRTDIWNRSWQLFLDHPLAGVGSGAFPTATLGSGRSVVHNVVLGILSETGLIGLSLFAIVLALVGRSALRHPSDRTWMWLAVLAVWFVGAMSLSLESRKMTWVILALVSASAWAKDKSDTLPPHSPRNAMSQKTET